MQSLGILFLKECYFAILLAKYSHFCESIEGQECGQELEREVLGSILAIHIDVHTYMRTQRKHFEYMALIFIASKEQAQTYGLFCKRNGLAE